MAYVGNQTTTSFTSMEKQVITGNGSASYALSHAVANAAEVQIFVNNVRQEPLVAYNVAGTALTMTGNVASSDDFYVVYSGKAVQTVVPPDGSVGTAKIVNSAVTDAKLATSLDLSSKTLTVPAGHVIQVVMGTSTSTFQQTANASSQDTGLSASITPSATSSKVLITTSAPLVLANTEDAIFYLVRGSSNVMLHNMWTNEDSYTTAIHSFSYLDSPSTTSATTYKVMCQKDQGEIFYNYINAGTSTATMILMEIAG